MPLFVEEITRHLLESAPSLRQNGRETTTDARETVTIPPTLHALLLTRLERLGESRAVAQMLATVGRECPLPLLQAIWPGAAQSLNDAVHRLVNTNLLALRGAGQQTTCVFKHVLFQEAAYQSLLRPTRPQYHQRIAQVFEAQFPETARQQPELLAHHYTAADLATQALPYWQQAGQNAAQRSAYTEALHHFHRGLALLQTQAHTPARLQQELLLQTTLGQALMAIKGYAAPAVRDAYARAHELCTLLGSGHRSSPCCMACGAGTSYVPSTRLPRLWRSGYSR